MIIDRLFCSAGRKFHNFIFRKRLGRKRWSARLIFIAMSFFASFETYSNTENVGNFDHYVSRFLLSKWKIAENGTDKGRIFCWLKKEHKIKKVDIKKTAGEKNGDTAKAKGVNSDFVSKKIFAELLERKSSKIIEIIDAGDSLDLTFLEESTLSVFLAHQITRVPAFRKTLLCFFSAGFSNGLIKHNDFGDKEILTDKVAFNKIGITYDQLLNVVACTITERESQILLLSLKIASIISEKIYKGNLHIIEIPSNSSDEFVISDNPVVFLDLDRAETLRLIPWWEIGEKNFLIFMPISPRKAIFYSKSKKKDGPIERSNEALVQIINFGQYFHSSNAVYSCHKEIIENHLKMYLPDL